MFPFSRNVLTPSIVIALAILNPATMALSAGSPSDAGGNVDRSLDADPAGTVRIQIPRGDLRIVGGDTPQVRVHGVLDEAREAFRFDREGAVVIVDLKIADRTRGKRPSDLVVEVPRASILEVEWMSTDVEVEAVHGAARFQGVSGDLNLQNVAGPLDIAVISGDVTVASELPLGTLDLETVSGDVVVAGELPEIRAETVSGDLQFRVPQWERLVLSSVSGDLSLIGSLATEGRVEAATISGDVTLSMTGVVDARFQVQLAAGGELKGGLVPPTPGRFGWLGGEQEFQHGDGRGSVRITSVSGEITLEGSR